MFSPLEQFDLIGILKIFIIGLDFSILNGVLPFFIILFFYIYFLFFIKLRFKLIPDVWQIICENIYKFVFNIVDQQVGKKGYIYFPFIFIIFNFILLSNLLSLIPFGIALTSYIVLIFFLSISICIFIFFLGLIKHNVGFFKLFIPKCPFILLPILIPIEIFSYIIRMFSLAIRLAANILAGHTLLFIISSFSVKVFSMKFWFYFLVYIIFFFIFMLELGIAFLQAYVFSILICIYLNDSLSLGNH